MVNGTIEEYFGKDCTIENPIFSNVLGYYNFMIAKESAAKLSAKTLFLTFVC